MAEIEPFEAKVLINILRSRPSEAINYETLDKLNSFKRHRLSMLALNDIEKKFFYAIKPAQINQAVIEELNAWREELDKDDERLGFMLKQMFPDVNIILNLKRFTVSLIQFIDKVKNKTHDAFKDLEAFERNLLPYADDPELKLIEANFRGYFHGDFKVKEMKYSRVKTSLSPESLINGFSAQDKILIDPVEDFVFSCFQFHPNSQVKVTTGHFTFQPRFKHSLTALLFDMKRKQLILSTNEEITELIVQLIPDSSRVSIKKYSSPSKKISSNHSIDIQLFS